MSDEASPESKLNICTYFIMSSPTGECDDVVADVQKLVPEKSIMGDEPLNKILKDYNSEQMVWAADPEDNKAPPILVSAYGMVDATQYLDPNSGRVLKFDHKKRKFTAVSDKRQVLDDGVAAYRAAIAKSLEGYMSGQYKSGKVVSATYGADNGAITVCISAKNVNLSNFWSGGWRSVFTVNVGKKGQTELKGSIKVNVHYFEDGNVQLHGAIDKTAQVNVQGEEETAKEVAKAIGRFETEWQSNLEEMYVNMHRTTFKAMRRFLPITKQPMTWSAAAHSLASEVNKS
jgi:capping protein alpha